MAEANVELYVHVDRPLRPRFDDSRGGTVAGSDAGGRGPRLVESGHDLGGRWRRRALRRLSRVRAATASRDAQGDQGETEP
jgi:hypothetical protein